jgi:hypothetical protein
MVTPPEHLLAMKVRAARALRDADDIRFLLKHLHIDRIENVKRIVSQYFPDDAISNRSVQLVEDILSL